MAPASGWAVDSPEDHPASAGESPQTPQSGNLRERRWRLARKRPRSIGQLSQTAAGRRQLTLMLAAVGLAAALVTASFVSVPYVILSPGPTLNTLGALGTH